MFSPKMHSTYTLRKRSTISKRGLIRLYYFIVHRMNSANLDFYLGGLLIEGEEECEEDSKVKRISPQYLMLSIVKLWKISS